MWPELELPPEQEGTLLRPAVALSTRYETPVTIERRPKCRVGADQWATEQVKVRRVGIDARSGSTPGVQAAAGVSAHLRLTIRASLCGFLSTGKVAGVCS
jgi:hypothetical protein